MRLPARASLLVHSPELVPTLDPARTPVRVSSRDRAYGQVRSLILDRSLIPDQSRIPDLSPIQDPSRVILRAQALLVPDRAEPVPAAERARAAGLEPAPEQALERALARERAPVGGLVSELVAWALVA